MAHVDWSRVDTVFLDMDGTLLDLHFDNRFWIEHIPLRWGEMHGMSQQQAFDTLLPRFKAVEGTLDWYSVEYWKQELGLDIVELKNELAHLIRLLPQVEEFLAAVRDSGRRLVLLTNAHDHTLEFKLARIRIGRYFDAMYTSHQFGLPKEGEGFWERVAEVEDFARERSLFVDDSLRVLENARAAGIGQVIAISRPDSQQDARAIDGFAAVEHIHELTPLAADATASGARS